jgi:hypothetical protein
MSDDNKAAGSGPRGIGGRPPKGRSQATSVRDHREEYVNRQGGSRQVAEWTMPQDAGGFRAGDVVVVEFAERRQRPR